MTMEEMYLLLSNSSSDTIRYAKDIYIYTVLLQPAAKLYREKISHTLLSLDRKLKL